MFQSGETLGTAANLAAVACLAALLFPTTPHAWSGPLFIASAVLAVIGLLCGLAARRSRMGKLVLVVALALLAALSVRLLQTRPPATPVASSSRGASDRIGHSSGPLR